MILWALILVPLVLFGMPALTLWAINTLFGTAIVHTALNYLATWVLLLLIGGSGRSRG